jgi:hypothetical protein
VRLGRMCATLVNGEEVTGKGLGLPG